MKNTRTPVDEDPKPTEISDTPPPGGTPK